MQLMVTYFFSKDNKKNRLKSFNKTISIHINNKTPFKWGFISKKIVLL